MTDTVLVTGAFGFVGLNLLDTLLGRGRHVVAMDPRTPPEAASLHFATLPGRLTHLPGDATDPSAWDAALAHAGPAPRIAHLAAITAGPERERREARRILDVNLGSALVAVEAAARANAPRLVLLSSAAIYGPTPEPAPFLDEETTRPRPANLYGWTKLGVEGMGLRLASLHGVAAVAVRLGAVWGPWEHATGLRDTLSPMHDLIEHRAQRREAVLHPDATTSGRLDWVYARDAGEGLAALLDAPSPEPRAYNLGSGTVFGVDRVAIALAKADTSFQWRIARSGEAPTIPHRYPTIRPPFALARIEAAAGWRPRFTEPAEAVRDWLVWADRQS